MRQAEIRLQAIQSMLVAGQRSVQLERHSLLIWGAAGGLLCMLTEHVLTLQRIPDNSARALAVLLWLSFWIGSAALLDHSLTLRARQDRDEVVPFAQAQITRAWWMLLSMGILSTFAMFFYGGGHMLYALWIVLLGMGIYLFGLFSRPLIEWIGIATILLGVAALASGLPMSNTRWLAASCFAVGLPLAGFLGQRSDNWSFAARILALGLWLVLVAAPTLLIGAARREVPAPTAKSVALGAFHPTPGEQVVRIPSGTVVALQLDLDSALLSTSPSASMSIVLRQPIQLSTHDGQPDGPYRLEGQPWRDVRDGDLRLRIDSIQAQMDGKRPILAMHAVFHTPLPHRSAP